MSAQTSAHGVPAKPRYRPPTHYVDAEYSLDDFSDEEILEYLRHRGKDQEVQGLLSMTADELGAVDTLLLCGQKETAREIVNAALTKALGRDVRL